VHAKGEDSEFATVRMESKVPEQESSQAQWNAMAEDLGIDPKTSSSEDYKSPFAYAKRIRAKNMMKESQKDSPHKFDLDTPAPGLEDSSMDTDASEEVSNALAGKEPTVDASPRKHTESPVSEFGGLMESSPDEELSAPLESEEWDHPTTPTSSASIVTDLVANTELGSSRRSKSGAGMFSKLQTRGPAPDLPVRVNKSKDEEGIDKPRQVSKKFASNSKDVPAKPRPYRRPKDSTSNDEDVQVRTRRPSKDSTMKTKNVSRRAQAKAAMAKAAKAKKRDVRRRKKRQVADDDSSDSGSVSTMETAEEGLVTTFLDLLDLDMDPFEEDNPFEEDHSVGSATAFDSEASGATDVDPVLETPKTQKHTYICQESFEGLIEYMTAEDVQAASSEPKKSKPSKKVKSVEDKVAQDEPANIGAVAASSEESSPALGLADFFDISFFRDLWNELFPPKNNLESADQTSPSGDQDAVNLSLTDDNEAENIFDDLLDDDANDDDSFAGLATILSSTSTAVNELRVELFEDHKEATGTAEPISEPAAEPTAEPTAEPVNESQEEVTPHTSLVADEIAEMTPKVPENRADADWQQFFDSPFKADGTRAISTPSRLAVSTPPMEDMEEPILLKRLLSLDAKCSPDTPEEQELTAPDTPDDLEETDIIYSVTSFDVDDPARKQEVSSSSPRDVQLYPPSDEAFEQFETEPTNEKDELFACGPASRFSRFF
jgi:hypothetical protein